MRSKFFLAVAVLSASLAQADTLTLMLTSPNGFVPFSGGSLAYEATVSAPAGNGAPVFLNGDSFSVAAPVLLNDSDFFANFPLDLAPGASYTGDLFELIVPPGPPLSTYSGTFTLLGGPDSAADNVLGAANFRVTTTNMTATPEPSSLALLLAGLVGAVSLGRRRSIFVHETRERNLGLVEHVNMSSNVRAAECESQRGWASSELHNS